MVFHTFFINAIKLIVIGGVVVSDTQTKKRRRHKK